MSIASYAALEARVRGLPPVGVAVAAAADPEVIDSLKAARNLGLIERAFLAGNEAAIRRALVAVGDDPAAYEILPAVDDAAAARAAVAKIREGSAGILVKGSLKTEVYLKAILDRESGLRSSGVLSNLSVFEMGSYHKLLGVTDNAVLVQPTLDEKKALIENTRPVWRALEIDPPKVAILAAVETVSAKMPATMEAAALVMMARRGQIKGFVLDGPLGYDAAINRAAAEHKGLGDSPVAGDPDLILCPNLETANSLGKSFKFHGQATWGGLILGAAAPAVLNSRSDDRQNRLNSLFLARAICAGQGS